MLKNAMQFSHQLLKEVVQPNDLIIDATMGNGHDTLFMSQLISKKGHLYSFDVQSSAIKNTQKILIASKVDENKISLIKDSHENINHHVTNPIKAALFNLGYLPGSDKSIITQPSSTLRAIKECMDLSIKHTRIIIVSYYGHPGGKKELEEVEKFIKKIDQHKFNCLKYEFINQQNEPPILFCIEKRK